MVSVRDITPTASVETGFCNELETKVLPNDEVPKTAQLKADQVVASDLILLWLYRTLSFHTPS